jgi:hypothetical protein
VIVLSHRGYWLEPGEKNEVVAFRRSFDLGFGTETDVRDRDGELVISHDPPGQDAMTLEAFMALLPSPDLPLAINVKADGLGARIGAVMAAAGHRDWFLFDMSVPDAVVSLRSGQPIFSRLSEYEPEPAAFLAQAQGIWLDHFVSEWWDAELVLRLLDAGKRVCVVSPELHRRPHLACWQVLLPLAGRPGLMICTDLPEAARDFFSLEGQA